MTTNPKRGDSVTFVHKALQLTGPIEAVYVDRGEVRYLVTVNGITYTVKQSDLTL